MSCCFVVEINNSRRASGAELVQDRADLNKQGQKAAPTQTPEPRARVLMKPAIKTDFINATTALFMTEGREEHEEKVEVKGSLCNSDCSGHRARAV